MTRRIRRAYDRTVIVTGALCLLGVVACTACDRDPKARATVEGGTSPLGTAAADGGPSGTAAAQARADADGSADAVKGAIDSRPPVLEVPRLATPLVPAAHFRLKPWEGAAQTHTLLDDAGHGAVPVSEARLLWSPNELYIRFYAGDLDLQVHATKHDAPVWDDDSVAFSFPAAGGRRSIIQISPTGVVADGVCPDDTLRLGDPRCDLAWESHVRVATDYDGTINQVGDFDEEWSVEVAVPLKSLAAGGVDAGSSRVGFIVSRCEIAYGGRRACGSWGKAGGVLVLLGAS